MAEEPTYSSYCRSQCHLQSVPRSDREGCSVNQALPLAGFSIMIPDDVRRVSLWIFGVRSQQQQPLTQQQTSPLINVEHDVPYMCGYFIFFFFFLPNMHMPLCDVNRERQPCTEGSFLAVQRSQQQQYVQDLTQFIIANILRPFDCNIHDSLYQLVPFNSQGGIQLFAYTQPQ